MSLRTRRRPLLVPRYRTITDSDLEGINLKAGLANLYDWCASSAATRAATEMQVGKMGESTTTGSGMTAEGTTTPIVQTLKDSYGWHRQVVKRWQVKWGSDVNNLGLALAFRQANDHVNGTQTGWSFTGTWGYSTVYGLFAGAQSLAGGCRYATGTSNTAQISRIGDRIKVVWHDAPDSGTFTVKVDGVTVATLGAANGTTVTPAARAQTILLGSGGLHTIQIVAPATGRVYLDAAEAWTGAGGLRGHSLAMSGRSTAECNGQYMLDTLGVLGLKQLLVMWTGNDGLDQTHLDTYQANLNLVIDAVGSSCSVVLMSTNPYDMSGVALDPLSGTQLQIAAAMKAVAAARGCGYLGLSEIWQRDYLQMKSMGYSTDGLHPVRLGYDWLVSYILSRLQRGLPR